LNVVYFEIIVSI